MTDLKAAIIRMEGTNCEEEMKQAFELVGFKGEHIHIKQLTGDSPKELKRNIFDYDVLMFPGGWSAGDYVRAGAVFAARLKSKIGKDIDEFDKDGRLVGGVCNGFQILTTLGLLPAFKGMSEVPDAILTNNPQGFQCRPTYLRVEGKSPFTEKYDKGKVIQIPVANGEGRLTFGKNKEKYLKQLEDNDQIAFRYCMPDGSDAKGKFPWNPSSSFSDIAGITNPEKNVLGMMPHPERVMNGLQNSDWTRTSRGIDPGDGLPFFQAIFEYAKGRM